MTKKDRERRRKKFEEKWKPAYDAFIALYPFTTESLDGEIWLPIPYCDDYHMSNFGRVKSFKNGEVKILKPQLDTKGYLYVQLSKNGKHKHFHLSVLVGTLFIPNPDNKPEVNHIYSKFSNHVDCLEWTTKSENMEHAVRTGLSKSGEDSPKAKLTNEQVIYIRNNPDGLNTYQLAEKFGVKHQVISKIQRGKSRKDAGGKIRTERPKRIPHYKITDEMRAQILADYQPGVQGHGSVDVGKRFGCSHRTVLNIYHAAQAVSSANCKLVEEATATDASLISVKTGERTSTREQPAAFNL